MLEIVKNRNSDKDLSSKGVANKTPLRYPIDTFTKS